ncbi:hypothetical protein [Reyranella sp.]|uniref:LPD3 domain-containing protein n=1 Tax=Reyranella sp. TaxID=1929291 RepID=UPI002F932A5B
MQEARSQLADLSAQQPDITSFVDRDTALRLQDIERDLGQPALAKKQRTSLEQEREMILGTVDPNDRLPRQAEREQAKQVKQLQDRIAKLEKQHGEARATADAAVADLRRKLGRHGEEFQPQQVMDATSFQEPVDFAAALQRADLMRQARLVREHMMPEEGAGGRRGVLAAPEDAGGKPGSSALEGSTAGNDYLARIDREARALIAGVPSGKETPLDLDSEVLAPRGTAFRELRRLARDAYNKFIKTTVKNEVTGHAIEFDALGQKKTLTVGEELIRLVPHLPELLRTAEPMGPPRPDKLGRPDIVAWHAFRKVVRVDGKPFAVVMTVRETGDGKFHYSLGGGPEPAGAGGLPAPEDRGDAVGSSARKAAPASDVNLEIVPAERKSTPIDDLAREHEQADQGVKEAGAIQGCLGGPKEGDNG